MNLSLEGGGTGNLPGFSVYSSDKRFVDLFNSGTGNISWTASVSDKWIKLSEMSGQFEHEARIWVSIDRDLVPRGDAQHGVITISGTGRSNDVAVTVFSPATPVANAPKGFVESHGYVSMEAEHYSRKADKGGAGWDMVDGLGRNGRCVTVLPSTISSRTNVSDIMQNSPLLEYDLYLFSTGAVSITINCIPTQSINAEHGRRLAVAFDGDTSQLVSPQRGGHNVINNMMSLRSQHQILAAGQHTLKIWAVDPGVVLDKIVIDSGGLKDSYMGPPESDRNPEIPYRPTARRPK
jgi:hypothetical protein